MYKTMAYQERLQTPASLPAPAAARQCKWNKDSITTEIRKRCYLVTLTFYFIIRSEEHTSELQSLRHLVCRLLLEKKKIKHLRKKRIHLTMKKCRTPNTSAQQAEMKKSVGSIHHAGTKRNTRAKEHTTEVHTHRTL